MLSITITSFISSDSIIIKCSPVWIWGPLVISITIRAQSIISTEEALILIKSAWPGPSTKVIKYSSKIKLVKPKSIVIPLSLLWGWASIPAVEINSLKTAATAVLPESIWPKRPIWTGILFSIFNIEIKRKNEMNLWCNLIII